MRPPPLYSDSGYTDVLFEYLGADSTCAMDASAYEGADILHDLNLPVHGSLFGSFDTVFDGGTLEHVFNFPVAISNVQRMLKNGLFISVNGANNFLGHGFYQFSPELMWRAFSTGFIIEMMQLCAITGQVPDPSGIPSFLKRKKST